MIIGVCQITLQLPDCHSLKEKRQAIKPLMARVRNQFEVSIAEVADNDRWQIAQFGIACVGNDSRHIDEVLAHVRCAIEEMRPDLPVINVETELMRW
jgi:uncharacterized protein YlxP (DUF503 family)